MRSQGGLTLKALLTLGLSLVLALVAIPVIAGPAFGQETFGSLNGVASDQSGGVLPGVSITVTNKETNRTFTTVTGSDGSFALRNLPPGRYTAKFERTGFRATEFQDVAVLVGQTLKLDPKMQVGGVQTAVEVTSEAPLIDTQSALVAHNVTDEEFNLLPKSRTFQYFAITAPAVNTGDIEGGIQVNGASGAENVFNIDGITTNSGINGASRQNAAFEYLSEVQIKTSGIQAEYGGALGGVITAVSKSGGNQFHGEAHFYWTGSKIGASSVQRLVLDPRDTKLSTVGYFQDAKYPVNQYEPGFSLGGPFVKDKLFFFTSLSPRWSREDRPYLYASGTDPGEQQRKQTINSSFSKISFDPTSRIRSNFAMLWSPTNSVGSFAAYNAAGPNWVSSTKAANFNNTKTGFFSPQTSYTGNVDFILGSHMLLSTRGGYFWDNYKSTGVSSTTSYTYQAVATAALVGANGPVGASQFTNTPRTLLTNHDLVTRAYGQADLSVSGNLAGSHTFRTGYGLQKTVNNVDNSYPGGYVYLWWDQAFTSPATSKTARGTYGYYEVNEQGTKGTTGAGIKSFYVQDKWQVHRRVTLDLGLRVEQERIPSFRRDIKDFAFDFGWSDKVAPRLGGSVDVFGDGKIKLFGSWGRYFDWTKYELVRGTFGGDTWRTYYRSLDTLDIGSLNLSNMPGVDLFNPGVVAFRDQRVPSFGDESVDPNIKPMSQDQFSVGADFQWSKTIVFGARYLHNNLRRTIEDLGVIVDGNEVYIYANPGEGFAQTLSSVTTATAMPVPYPKPIRRYDALELTFEHRMSNGWFGNLSYTLSRLYGNYAGIASSDEIRTPTTGVSSATSQQLGGNTFRQGGNANRAWDLDELLFDSKGNFDVRGPLATDRPHVLKLNGGYVKNWGSRGHTNIGGFFYLGSGTPMSTEVQTRFGIPVYVNGRGDMGRTPVLNYTDLQFGHDIDVAEGHKLRFEFNMLNVFNQKTARHIFNSVNRGQGVRDSAAGINLGAIDLRKGYDYKARIDATTAQTTRSLTGANAYDPRFGMNDLFNPGFQGRFGIKYIF